MSAFWDWLAAAIVGLSVPCVAYLLLERWVRRRLEVRREDLARWDRTEEQVLAHADDLKAWREAQTVAVPLKLPPVHEPEPDEPDDGGCEYVGRHRRREIGAGWGVPYLPAWYRISTQELEARVATWAADLGEPVRPVRGQAPEYVEIVR